MRERELLQLGPGIVVVVERQEQRVVREVRAIEQLLGALERR